MEGCLELGGFRMAILLTATSLYVVASMPYPLAMWSVLGMPQNGHHDHKTLRQCNMDLFLWGYLMDKVYNTALPKVQDIRQVITREVIALRQVHFVREGF